MSTYQKRHSNNVERYTIDFSPLAQKPTQKQLAELVGLKKSQLCGIIDHKEEYIIRRELQINGKNRKLVYPFGKYRSIHEKLKFHLNKVIQPPYLFSPRRGKTQRLNAVHHIGQIQYLKLDIKQFYPSTSKEHVFRWAKYELGMRDDVAGLFTHIATIDGFVAFGSPLTPVLTTLVHKRMFDRIASECSKKGLRISLWVDDIVISGKFVPGSLVTLIRDIIRTSGLRSHKLEYFAGSRGVTITGIIVNGTTINAPRKLHNEISDGYGSVIQSDDPIEVAKSLDKLLSTLGRYRSIVGITTSLGRKASNRMNELRQKKSNFIRKKTF